MPSLLARAGLAWKSASAIMQGNGAALANYGGYGPSIPPWYPVEWYQKGMSPGLRNGLPIVEACVGAYAQTIASMPANHVQILDNGGYETVTSSALSRLMLAPNDYQTPSDFFLNIVRSLYLKGNAYAFAEYNNRQEVSALHPVDPTGVRVVRAADDPSAYWYSFNQYQWDMLTDIDPGYFVPPRQMLHIKLACPLDPLCGETPLTHALLSNALGATIGGSLSTFYANMSRPSGVLTTEGELNKVQVERLRSAWEDATTAIAQGKVPILVNGLKWAPMGMTAQDAGILDAYKLTIIDIARVFRIPLSMIGEMEGATFTNSETLIRFWMSTGLGFAIKHIEDAFTAFFNLPRAEQLEFDTSVLLRTDTPARLDSLSKAVQGGIYSPNEARAMEGLPAKAYGDEPRLQRQVVPLSAYANTPAPVAADPNADDPADGNDATGAASPDASGGTNSDASPTSPDAVKAMFQGFYSRALH
jgi:HK97 family phage portal protein